MARARIYRQSMRILVTDGGRNESESVPRSAASGSGWRASLRTRTAESRSSPVHPASRQ